MFESNLSRLQREKDELEAKICTFEIDIEEKERKRVEYPTSQDAKKYSTNINAEYMRIVVSTLKALKTGLSKLKNDLAGVNREIEEERSQLSRNEAMIVAEEKEKIATEQARALKDEAEKRRKHQAEEAQKQRDHELQMAIIQRDMALAQAEASRLAAEANAKAQEQASSSLDALISGVTGNGAAKDRQ